MTLLEICVVVATMFWCGMMIVKTISTMMYLRWLAHEVKETRLSCAAYLAGESEQTKK